MHREGAVVALALLASLAVSAENAPPRFTADTQVVVLDLVASDRRGKPVEDLRAEEIRVFEDGKPCEVLSLGVVRAKARPQPSAGGSVPTQTSRTPEAATATPTRPSLVVLVFDRLSQNSAPLARSGALDLMRRSFPPDTWFAVFKVGYGIILLESFTTDAGRLQGAIERATAGDRDLRAGPLAPSLPPERVSPEDGDPGKPQNSGRIPSLRDVAKMLAGREASEDRRINGMDSLYAIKGVAQALENVEGRKSIVYFAEAWALGTSSQSLFEDVVSTANRANIAVHTVDARGLSVRRPGEFQNPFDQVLSNFTASSRETINPLDQTPKPAAHLAEPSSQDFEATEDHLRGPRLRSLAEDTGGLAIGDTNDLGSRLALVADELRLYYEVIYAPANPAMDGRFRTIDTKVTRAGVRVRGRKGYFANPRKAAAVAAYELPLLDALGAPNPRADFTVRADVFHFGKAGTERVCTFVAEVPLSEVQIDIEPTDLTYNGHLSLVGFIKDAGDHVVARLTQDLPVSGPLGDRERALSESATFRRTLPLAPGSYTLELAVQDRPRNALSVSRTAFAVPPASDLPLGSVTIVERAIQAPAETPADDPLRVGDLLFIPSLGAPVVEGSRPNLPVFAALWPRPGAPAEVVVELRRNEAVVARATPTLPAAEGTGRVTWVGSIPAARLTEGRYDLVVTARQGAFTAAERTSIAITPAPVAVASPRPPAVTDPELSALLERAGRYVVEYQESFKNVVAEEVYTQRVVDAKWLPKALPSPPIQFEDKSLQVRTRADVVFVRLVGSIPWGVFRDVFEANGAKVRDRDERLQKLLERPSASAREQAQRILVESSRFNMGLIRTANIPTLPLVFLHPRNQSRFAFRMGERRKFGGFEGIEVQFEEVVKPGLVNTGWGETLTASGRFWIEPSRGAVLRSETAYGWKAKGKSGTTGRISTEYRPEPTLGIFVPDEMKERYYDGTQATARYTNLRRFDVSVESETFTVPTAAK